MNMTNECELIGKCGFFKKYQETKDLACKGFLRMYCRGEKMSQCKRREYRDKNGTPPPDEMMPNGQIITN